VSRPQLAGLLVVLLGFGGLLVSWAVSNPIGAAPDEPAHYIKALGVGGGQLLGQALAPSEQPVFGKFQSELDTLPLVHQLTRRVTIPANLEPDTAGCTAGTPDVAATCINVSPATTDTRWGTGTVAYTYLGTYQPFVYAVPGLAMRTAATALGAFIIGRLAFGAIALALIALGAFLCLEIGSRRLVLVGVLAAVTPMVVFTSATISAGSSEIAAGVAVTGAVLHLGYGGRRKRLAWAALAIGGAVLAVSRTLGPLWIVMLVGAGIGVAGWRPALATFRRNLRWAIPVTAVVGAACLASLAWQLIVQPRPPLHLSEMGLQFVHAFNTIPTVIQEEIGVFGWLDTEQAYPSTLLWEGLIWSMVTLALWVGSRRERWTLGSLVVANLVLTPILYPVIGAPAGVVVQGRWLLPVAVSVPLLAGVVCARHLRLSSRAARWLPAGLAAVVAGVQFLALYQNDRRYAVGSNGPLLFFRQNLWSPLGGWGLWLSVTLVSCLAIAAGSALLGREGPSDVRIGQPPYSPAG
jgi:Predicted membrane protein (DUF2142)